ncbi:DUF21 domain-containing protein At1g55930, chloroplastic-like isoform X6, partial [Fagus crenata]
EMCSGCGFKVCKRVGEAWIVLAAMVCGLLCLGCRRVFAMKGFRKDQDLFLRRFGLPGIFSMAETSNHHTLALKVLELAEKDSENGVFKTLRSDVTRFLTTILIGTTVVNIGATALVTEAATAIFGEAGVSAATGVMTVAILLLTEITPKSIAVHNATEVARFVMSLLRYIVLLAMLLGQTSGVAFLGIISCGKSCYIFIYGDAKNPWFKRNK